MKKSQLNAISYAISKKRKQNRIIYILEKEGTMLYFTNSKYKSEYWYILSKYGVRVY